MKGFAIPAVMKHYTELLIPFQSLYPSTKQYDMLTPMGGI